MNADAKKTVLRMIPYGIYVLTADDGQGNIAAATVNWVTQSAFAPPLVVVGVKTDSGAYKVLKATQAFALNMLGKEQKGAAFAFFKPTSVADGKLSGQSYRKGVTGAPILTDAPGAVECRVVSIVEQGDHHIVVGEVVEAHLNHPPTGRPDAAILERTFRQSRLFCRAWPALQGKRGAIRRPRRRVLRPPFRHRCRASGGDGRSRHRYAGSLPAISWHRTMRGRRGDRGRAGRQR
jgi:flavin reductase (DIM6/NTAB) family NADH-FMN oxidoreductase RutF